MGGSHAPARERWRWDWSRVSLVMETFLWQTRCLMAAALLLTGAAVVLASRGAGRRAWLTHGVLSTGVGVAMLAAAHAAGLGAFAPWWRTGAAYLGALSAPVLAAGWAGRWAARCWPTRPRWRVGVAAVAAFLVVAIPGGWLAFAVLPEFHMINAVQ